MFWEYPYFSIKVCLRAKTFYHMIHSYSGPLKKSSNTKISDSILMKCNKSTKLFIFITFKPLYNNLPLHILRLQSKKLDESTLAMCLKRLSFCLLLRLIKEQFYWPSYDFLKDMGIAAKGDILALRAFAESHQSAEERRENWKLLLHEKLLDRKKRSGTDSSTTGKRSKVTIEALPTTKVKIRKSKAGMAAF